MAKNMAAFKKLVAEVDESDDKDKMAMLAATDEGLGAVFHIPVSDEAEQIKKIVHAPEGYESLCLLTIGCPAENAFLPKQKEIKVEDRIHLNDWLSNTMKWHILVSKLEGTIGDHSRNQCQKRTHKIELHGGILRTGHFS